ncbi:hypothetical protein CKAN_00865900 [Cinnamomum micranthum f. kanehirae]|uniref:Uncharacterized protein n=1 Tax=Cinnamomum micranthum f. kanehirae TaxID=337451 RepID=A0A443NNF1_9MAGN|nr:hypothetical protein CKAN_00865900 [Cinnamomum micranthum f. kanehirae]
MEYYYGVLHPERVSWGGSFDALSHLLRLSAPVKPNPSTYTIIFNCLHDLNCTSIGQTDSHMHC